MALVVSMLRFSEVLVAFIESQTNDNNQGGFRPSTEKDFYTDRVAAAT